MNLFNPFEEMMERIPMLDIVQMPLARRIWRLSKFFQIPINDSRIQDMNIYDIEFYELSMIADDPKKLEQLQNHFYDPDFDDWLDDFEREQEEKSSQEEKFNDSESLDMPDKETIEWSEKNRSSQQFEQEYEDYEISESVEINDWEEVN